MKKVGVIFPLYMPIVEDAYKFYGGLEIRTISLVKYLSEKGYDVTVFAARGSQLDWDNVTLRTGHYPIWDGKGVHPYELDKDLINSNLDLLKTMDAVLEDNHFSYYHYLYQTLGLRNKQQILKSWDHSPQNLTALPNFPCNIVCVAKWQRNVLREQFKNKGHNFYWAYSGINLDYYKDYIKDVSFDGPILFLSRFSQIKGAHLVMQMAEEMPEQDFLFLGDSLFTNEPSYGWNLKAKADKLSNVKMIFNCSWEEKIEALQKCKFLIHPSIWHEILGFDVLEAQYFGKYAVGFAKGGLLETIKHNKTGLLIPETKNPDINYSNLVSGVKILLKKEPNPEVCRKHVEDKFDFLKYAAPVYEDIINGKEPKRQRDI